jgi:TRAP-type C4-dicarboxylate transport system permease small subunit
MQAFRRAAQAGTRALAALAALLIVVLVVATSIDVILRNSGHGSLAGVQEYSEIILVSLAFLAMPFGQQRGQHISLVLVTNRLPVLVARWVRVFGQVATLVLMATLAVLSLQMLNESIRTDEVRYGLLQVPVWPARVAILIGFIFLMLETAFKVVDALSNDRQGLVHTPLDVEQMIE